MASPSPLLDRTAADLLDLFAAGKNTPGAGSAAALTGAVAGSLLQAVARYTLRAGKTDAEALLEDARERSRRLSEAVDEDAAAFERYWRLRTEEALGPAIEVPLTIAEHCAALVEIGVELYEKGFKAARGEAKTAVLLALASGEAALCIARLNLKFAETGPYEDRLNSLQRRLGDLRKGRIAE